MKRRVSYHLFLYERHDVMQAVVKKSSLLIKSQYAIIAKLTGVLNSAAFSLIIGLNLGSTSNLGFLSSHSARCFSGGAFAPVICGNYFKNLQIRIDIQA